MMVRRIVAFFMGAFLVLCGIYCTMIPVETYSSLAWIVGFVATFDSIIQLYTWDHLKNINFWNKWDIIGSFISLAIGIALICSFGVRKEFSDALIYVFGGWLMFCGILRIVAALQLRAFHFEFKTELLGKKWWMVLIIGLLLIGLGVLMCVFPIRTQEIIGILIGCGIIAVGINVALHSILF